MQGNETSLDPSEPSEDRSKYLWLGFPFVVFIWLGYGYLQGTLLSIDAPFDRLNTLFSGLAFWGVIYAILLQKSELILQRRELALTRHEVRGQKEQLHAQNHTLSQQRFENTFFSLLGLHSSLVNSMEVSPSAFQGATLKGRECFRHFYSEYQREYTVQKNAHADWGFPALCNEAYERFVAYRQTHVGHYFRTLYNIIKFIAANEIANKHIYINLLRAQLSSSELNLLFYNCLSKYGNEKFKPFVEQFGLLENITVGNLCNQEHANLYPQSAFKSEL